MLTDKPQMFALHANKSLNLTLGKQNPTLCLYRLAPAYLKTVFNNRSIVEGQLKFSRQTMSKTKSFN